MKTHYFYSKTDSKQEKLGSLTASSRLEAAKMFAQIKKLDLKIFLTLFAINK